MNKIKNYFVLAILLVILTETSIIQLFSQDKQHPVPVGIFYSNSNGNANYPMLTTVKPEENPKDPMLVQLEAQLDAARMAGNTIAAQQIQSQIDNLLGHIIVYHKSISSEYLFDNSNIEPQNDFNLSQIHSYDIHSHAFGIAPTGAFNQGNLFYLMTQGSDTLKLLQSSNNGANWGINLIWGFSTTYTFNNDELDMEIIYDGPNTWIFAVIGVTVNSNQQKRIILLRRKLAASGNSVDIYLLSFPGSSGISTQYYNPKITSDNSAYTVGSYLMISCSMDSVVSTNHYAKQKYLYSTSPNAPTPGFDYTQPNGTNGFYWATYLGSNSNAYLYNDIAYCNHLGVNKVISVYNCYKSGFNNIYISYANNYNTPGGNLILNESSENKNVNIAFNGGVNNGHGYITYAKPYMPVDWDIKGFRTTNGGSLITDWTVQDVDNTGMDTKRPDLIAIRGASGQFNICFSGGEPNTVTGFFSKFNGSSWIAKIPFTNAKIDTISSPPKAGYKLGSDNGIGLWSKFGGHEGYCSNNITTTTGIINNHIPSRFSLSQNYPNPFNPSTKIKFALPSAANVSLKVFDVTGKQVAELVNSSLPAGTHEYTFDASKLSSGVYFYRLESKGLTQIKKMMLVK